MGKTTTIQVFDHMTKNLDSSRISIPLFLLLRFWILARNGFSFEFLKKVENKYKLEKNMYKYFFELDSDFYNSAISRNPFYVISILLRLSS